MFFFAVSSRTFFLLSNIVFERKNGVVVVAILLSPLFAATVAQFRIQYVYEPMANTKVEKPINPV